MRYDQEDIAFEVPEGWEDKSVIAFAAKSSAPGRVTTNLALTRDRLPAGESLRKYADRQLVDLGRELRDLELVDSGPLEVDGCEAFELRCIWRSASGTVEQRLIMIAANEQAITLAVTGPRGKRKEIDAAAEQVLSTFRLKAGGARATSQAVAEASRPFEAPETSAYAVGHDAHGGVPRDDLRQSRVMPPALYAQPTPAPSQAMQGMQGMGGMLGRTRPPTATLPSASHASGEHGVPPESLRRSGVSESLRQTAVAPSSRPADPPSSLMRTVGGSESLPLPGSQQHYHPLPPPTPPPSPPSSEPSSSEATSDDRFAGLMRAAGQHWQVDPSTLVGFDLWARFAWTCRHLIVHVSDPRSGRSMVVAAGIGNPTHFVDERRTVELTRFFRGENIALPRGLSPLQLADAVHVLGRGPRSFVASKDFYQTQEPHLDAWVPPRRNERETKWLFHQLCVEQPRVEEKDGTFRLTFHGFNERGGVERWTVVGDSSRINSVDLAAVHPDETFRFPYGEAADANRAHILR